MKGLKPEDFPIIPQVARMCELRLPVKKFQEALGEVVFSASATSTRPILSGVCFQGKGDTLTLVSTDSFRLSEKILTLEKPLEEEIHAIIPGRTLTELSRLLSETEEEYISLILSDKQILFSFGNIQFTSRLIDGQFPNYKQILPQKSTTTVSLDKGILSLALKRVELFAKENKNNIKFHFLPAEKKVIITTDATQIGTNESEVELTGEGEENQIALDGSYILDVLQALPSGNIHIKIDHSKAPALFLHSDDPDYKHIIMPLQLS
jgi:DNA polymerase-3 subunit beta